MIFPGDVLQNPSEDMMLVIAPVKTEPQHEENLFTCVEPLAVQETYSGTLWD